MIQSLRIAFVAAALLTLLAVGNAQFQSPSGGTPCTTTANSVQYDNAGAFGCATEWQYTSAKKSLGDGSNWQFYWSSPNVDVEFRNSTDTGYVNIQIASLFANGSVGIAGGRSLGVGNITQPAQAPVILVPDGSVIGAGILGFLGCSTCLHSWSASTTNAQTPDTALGRNAAGVVEVNNGTLGTLRDMTLRSISNSGNVIDTGYSFQTPATGFTITLGNTTWHTVLDPSGTLATGTITMPAAPVDGMIINVRSSQVVTSLTVSPNTGQSIKGAPGSFAVGGTFECLYRNSNTTWYC